MPLPAMVSHKYVSMYIHIYERVCIHTYICVGVSNQHSMSLHRFPPYVWVNLVLTDSCQLASKSMASPRFCLHCTCWDCKYTPLHLGIELTSSRLDTSHFMGAISLAYCLLGVNDTFCRHALVAVSVYTPTPPHCRSLWVPWEQGLDSCLQQLQT